MSGIKTCVFVYISFLFIYCFCAVDCSNYEYTGYRNEIVGNPDDSAKILRPCMIYDLNCIRGFFGAHSRCKMVDGPIIEPIFTQSSAYVPRVNLSITLTNLTATGLLNTRIEEFYINKATNRLLISLEFRNLTISGRDNYFKFFRNGREPITTTDVATVTYKSVVITTVIPNIDDLLLEQAEITAYVNDFMPPFFIGLRAAQSSDPTVQLAVAQLVADVRTTIQELFLTNAHIYPLTYIQQNLCDFGLKIL